MIWTAETRSAGAACRHFRGFGRKIIYGYNRIQPMEGASSSGKQPHRDVRRSEDDASSSRSSKRTKNCMTGGKEERGGSHESKQILDGEQAANCDARWRQFRCALSLLASLRANEAISELASFVGSAPSPSMVNSDAIQCIGLEVCGLSVA